MQFRSDARRAEAEIGHAIADDFAVAAYAVVAGDAARQAADQWQRLEYGNRANEARLLRLQVAADIAHAEFARAFEAYVIQIITLSRLHVVKQVDGRTAAIGRLATGVHACEKVALLLKIILQVALAQSRQRTAESLSLDRHQFTQFLAAQFNPRRVGERDFGRRQRLFWRARRRVDLRVWGGAGHRLHEAERIAPAPANLYREVAVGARAVGDRAALRVRSNA